MNSVFPDRPLVAGFRFLSVLHNNGDGTFAYQVVWNVEPAVSVVALQNLDGDGVSDCNDTCPGVDDVLFGPCDPTIIPTLSMWGLIILTLSLMAAGKVYFGRRKPQPVR